MGSMADLASIEIFNAQIKMSRKNKYWGIELTKVEEMQWDKWKSDRNNCPALNTITHIERVELLINFLKSIRV